MNSGINGWWQQVKLSVQGIEDLTRPTYIQYIYIYIYKSMDNIYIYTYKIVFVLLTRERSAR